MIGKLVAAEIGRRVAGRQNGIKGALIGAAAPWLIRRAFTPAGIAIIGAIAVKRMHDKKKERERQQNLELAGLAQPERTPTPA